jgi:hypothetical protein
VLQGLQSTAALRAPGRARRVLELTGAAAARATNQYSVSTNSDVRYTARDTARQRVLIGHPVTKVDRLIGVCDTVPSSSARPVSKQPMLVVRSTILAYQKGFSRGLSTTSARI